MTCRASFAMVGLAALVLGMPQPAQATAITFHTSGAFDDAQPEGASVSGEGTRYFRWGDRFTPHNTRSSLKFWGRTSHIGDLAPGGSQDVVLGLLRFHNGTIVAGTGATSVDLDITLHFTTPVVLPPPALTLALALDNTVNTPGHLADWPDSVTLSLPLASTSFMNDGTLYTLSVLGFASARRSGSPCCYVGLDGRTLTVGEECEATVKILGQIAAVEEPIPEPGTLLLLGSGLLGLVLRRRRR